MKRERNKLNEIKFVDQYKYFGIRIYKYLL